MNFKNSNQVKKESNKLVNDLEKEINVLQHQIDHKKMINSKKNLIKNLKISASFIKRVTPYVICATMLANASKTIGLGYPFHIDDDVKAYAYCTEKIDNFGNYDKEKIYSDTDISDLTSNYVKYCDKYQKIDDDTYGRVVRVYRSDKIKEENIDHLLTLDEKELSDLLNVEAQEIYETTNNLTENLLKQDKYVNIYFLKKDYDDYIIVEESFSQNFLFTSTYLIFDIILDLFINMIERKIYKSTFKTEVNSIKNSYNDLSDEIKEKENILKIKKDNYNRLMR